MLGKHPVDVMLLATGLDVARSFYRDALGLQLLLEDPSSSPSAVAATAAWSSPSPPPGPPRRRPRPPGGWTTWPARVTESAGGRAIARALAVTYAIGVVLALWGPWPAPSTRWAGSRSP